jgi:hypothetical protein
MSLEDNSPYEGKLYSSKAYFPYDLKDMYAKMTQALYDQLHWE